MYFEEFGKENRQTIVMLHGAFFVHTFGRQYVLGERYHLLVPHLPGFGNNTEKDFSTEEAVSELQEFTASLGEKVTLLGFSLGAQLGYELLCRTPELFERAILVSPWLIKSDIQLQKLMKMNLSQLETMHDRTKCGMIAMMNGLPGKKRQEFVEQMQHVTETSVRACVDNGIVLSDAFRSVSIPVTALAGAKESTDMTASVRQMAEMNPLCTAEVWAGCAHNIPPLHAKEFNARIIREMSGGAA